MKYYVLGTKNNEMLNGYLKKYYIKLQKDLVELSIVLKKSDIKTNIKLSQSIQILLDIWEKNKDFIMNGDNSGIINLLHLECLQNKSQWLGKWNFYAEKLHKQIELFLDWKIEMLSQNTGTKIAGTNIRLSLKDNNPYGQMEAHPEHKINGGVRWWWEKTQDDWLSIYEKTFALLKNTDSWVYEELNSIITKIIPLWTANWLHNSASYKECIGHLYMWYTIDSDQPELNNLEAIIHESSHNKLNLIKQFDPLILNNAEEKYYSPYRPDARHISWIYLWIHAFVPVIYILMKALSKWKISVGWHWEEKIMLYYLKNKISYKVLKKHWKFSDLWNEILDEMYQVMCLTDNIFKTLTFSPDIISHIKNAQAEHFREVNSKYPYLEY